eukprot:TRINITY_DN3188_c0_g1_i2.p1 TRINITY_DN3188_c0_g1~~TRINITY_DN3188_c0_g1_i2.p1  ORF type:complete len:470 (-),score=66.54 TRINITY_DN3188_c0_g1_i2:291-1700(-)
MNGAPKPQIIKSKDHNGQSDGLTANASDDIADDKLRSKKRKLHSEESDEEEIEEEDGTSDEDRAEYLEDDEDDDFYPSTRAAAAARSGNSSTSPPATTSPPSSPSIYQGRRDHSEANLSLVETRKRRHRTTPEQLRILESAYRHERMPSLELREKLAQQLNMTPRRVQIWFQNKRAKDKRARISVRLQQHGKTSSRQNSSRGLDGQNGGEFSNNNISQPGVGTGLRPSTTASFVVPVRTADGKIALAAFPAAMVNQSANAPHLYSAATPPLAAMPFAAPMPAAAMQGNTTGATSSSMATPHMFMNPMMAAAGARYAVPGVPMYAWPGADPSMMWQAQLMAAQQQQMQLAASQLSQSQQPGQPKLMGYHPSYYVPPSAHASASAGGASPNSASGANQLPQLPQPQQADALSAALTVPAMKLEPSSDADVAQQVSPISSVTASAQLSSNNDSSRSTSVTSVEASQSTPGAS